MNPKIITYAWLIAVVVLALLAIPVDVLAIARSTATSDYTITNVIQQASRRWMVIPFSLGLLAGLVAGHFYWGPGAK